MLKDINTSKAIGHDKISNVIHKNCASQLAPGLYIKFQLTAEVCQVVGLMPIIRQCLRKGMCTKQRTTDLCL